MPKTERYSFSEFTGDSEASSQGSKMGKGSYSGCFVSIPIGFVLALLAIAIAVGVGIIVHFAEKSQWDRDLNCNFPVDSLAELLRQMQQGSGATTTTTTAGTGTPITTVTMTPTTASGSGSEDDDYRLPTNVRPIYYDLELTPDIYGNDPSAFSFSGHVGIEVECLTPTLTIKMNAKNLSIALSDVTVTGPAGALEVENLKLNDKMETLTITLRQELKKDERYRVNIAFSGPLTNDLAGLYLSSYQRGNQTVYLATTQFESPDAREAFPCFDEPAIKAHFNVTLVRKSQLNSLSNTQIRQSIDRGNGWVADVYETTPPMSTYLLAFIVSDFVHVNGTTTKGIQYGVWARKELSEMMEYALETGMKVLDYYGTVFGTDFPLKKQDMIAIPDFAAGAMENWGLITYRERYLYYQPGVTSEIERQQVTLVIAHELAHQWFGNLVTLAWWDDLWLNEGFATFIEYIGMDMIDPGWKVWEQFALTVIQYVFEIDQIVTSHPLFHPAKTVEEMQQYFDSISYEKGASVIHMLKFILGDGTFHNGLKKYLQDHKYANANHTDLWIAFARQAQEDNKNLDIADIMDTWTLQMGFPVVTAVRTSSQIITFSQKRFLINPGAKEPGVFTSPYGYKWEVPLTLTSSVQPNFTVTENDVRWLHKTETSKGLSAWVTLPDSGDTNGWFLVNVQQNGYYRVNYAESNWKALINQLNKDHKVISPVNRAQIVDDAWNLASAGELDVEIALSTLDYLQHEMDYVPWGAAQTQLTNLRIRMTGTSGFGALERFIQDKIRTVFNEFGFDDTNATSLQSFARKVAVSLACQSNLPECVQDAVQLFKAWRQDPDNNPISPAVRQQVYCTGVKEGDDSDWLFIRTRFEQEQSPSEKDYLRKALSCTSRVWILRTLLDMAISGKEIRRDDATGTISDVAKNDVGTAIAWDFVRDKWDTIIRDFGQSGSRLKTMINSIVSVYHTDFFYDELTSFISTHPDLSRAEVAMKQAVETVEFNIKWNQKYYPQIVNWLDSQGYKEFEGTGSDQGTVTPLNVRLPTDLRPLHYDITIEPQMYGPDPASFIFNGTMSLIFSCVTTTNKIVIHINELNVSDIEVGSASGQQSSPHYVSHEEDKAREFLIIWLDGNLTAGHNYSVSMDFVGPLDNKTLAGLYLSSYQNSTGTVYLATTQFEPTDARKAFPCLDEPAMKATFAITLIRRNFNKALSNMPISATVDLGDGRVADHFETSKPMSTYLVALIVCDFEHKFNFTKRNVRYEVWSRPAYVNQVDFALDLGVKVIDFYEDYFQIPFPLKKQSMAAIPDFAAGAMENWGLITYRETRILYEPGVSSSGNMESTSMTVAHELAHMWFGDLVSPVWWDELWLNEGFARFMQYLGTDHVFPDWKEFDQFVVVVLHAGMKMDGMVSSHPVYVPVATPAQINEIFDSISYDKGASVIRMIRHAIGEDTFKIGVTNYLNELQYKNAAHEDLWRALNSQAEKDKRNVNVGDVMDTWTLQMNFPVVMVARQNQTITLTQQRFLIDPTAKDPEKYKSPFGYKWDIPFTYTTSRNPKFTSNYSDVIWFMHNDSSKAITNTTLQTNDWVIANLKVFGYYRVNYDIDNWNKLANQLKSNHTVIDPVNRAQIINDAWNLASGGYINTSVALSVVEYLDKEMDLVPWSAAVSQLDYVSKMLASTEIYGAFQMFIRNKTGNQYGKLGMDNTGAPLLESFLRSDIAFYACSAELESCVAEAQSLFKQWRQNSTNNPIAPELRSTVYCTAIKHGSADDWNFLYEQYKVENNVNEKERIRTRLACSNELWILKRLLNRAMYSTDIRSQDSVSVMSQVALNPAGTALAWNFIRESWDDIFARYRKDPFALKNLVNSLGAVFNTRIQLEEIQAFVDAHPDLATATRAFQAAMETTRSNINWMDKNYQLISVWLKDQGYAV